MGTGRVLWASTRVSILSSPHNLTVNPASGTGPQGVEVEGVGSASSKRISRVLLGFGPEPLGNILQKRPVGMACTSGTRTLAAFQFVLVILNLTEDLLAAIFIDDSYGVHLLALLWACYAFGDGLLKVMAKQWARCSRWMVCLISCFVEAGQCILYVYLCTGDGVMWPLISLGAAQVFFKTGEGIAACRANANLDEVKDIDTATETQVILPVMHQWSDSCKCCHIDLIKLWLFLLSDILHGVFPLLFQEESPFRETWYRVGVCVMVWWKTLLLRLHPQVGTGTILFRAQAIVGFLVFTCLVWYWGLSQDLVATWDRVYTIIYMSVSTILCLFACCLCCVHGFLLCNAMATHG